MDAACCLLSAQPTRRLLIGRAFGASRSLVRITRGPRAATTLVVPAPARRTVSPTTTLGSLTPLLPAPTSCIRRRASAGLFLYAFTATAAATTTLTTATAAFAPLTGRALFLWRIAL